MKPQENYLFNAKRITTWVAVVGVPIQMALWIIEPTWWFIETVTLPANVWVILQAYPYPSYPKTFTLAAWVCTGYALTLTVLAWLTSEPILLIGLALAPLGPLSLWMSKEHEKLIVIHKNYYEKS